MVCALALGGVAALGGGLRVLDRASAPAVAVAVKSAPKAVPEDGTAVAPIRVTTQSITLDPAAPPDAPAAPRAAMPETATPEAPPAAPPPVPDHGKGVDRTPTASIGQTRAAPAPRARPEPRKQERPRASARSRGKAAHQKRKSRRNGRSRRHAAAPAPVEAADAGREPELASAPQSTSSAICWQLKSGGGRCVDRDLATSRAR